MDWIGFPLWRPSDPIHKYLTLSSRSASNLGGAIIISFKSLYSRLAIPCCQNAKILSTSIFEFTFQRFELNRSLVKILGRYQSVICCLMSICICCLFSVYIWLQMFVPACVNRGLAPAAAAGCYKYKSGQKYKTWTMERATEWIQCGP